MKKIYSLLMVLLLYKPTMAAITPEQLIIIKPEYIGCYKSGEQWPNRKELAMPFNESAFQSTSAFNALHEASIHRITLYYTVYKLADKFNQPRLNIERFRELKKHLPEAFNNSVIEWRIVGQTDCKNPEEARHYFHGFVIDYQPASTPESTVKEIKSIQYLALNDSLGKDTIYYKEVKHYRKRSIWTGYFLPRSKRKQREQVVYTERSIWNRKRQYSKTTDTIVTRLACREFIPSEYAITFIKQHTEDSTIFAIMNRNKNWRDMVFVVDVTGSMSTYNSQLFIWYKLNQRQREVRNFTFFNDGDSKRDGAKKVGKTGGIYCIDAKAQEEVIKKAMFCMDQGCGGDTPENNCEALLKSIQENPDSKEFFMIADNWANIRDTALISRITKPVHILLCGVVNDYYNEDYLNLARRTKGSVHTIDKDILDLCRLSEGEKIKLGEKWYIIHKGRLEKLIES